jgi:hypothetical protein
MMAHETDFLKAFGVFNRICQFMLDARRDGLRMDQIERQLKTHLAEAGMAFLQEHVEASGNGDQGKTVPCEGRVLRRSEEPQRRRYLSIFGELMIWRYVYSAGKKKPIEYAPLDAQLGLPAGEVSYVLEDFQQRLCVKSPFGKGVDDLKAILGTGMGIGTAEHMNQQMAPYAESYRLSALTDENTPQLEDEEELLVVAADGKGVLMRRPLEQRLKEELAATASKSAVPDGVTNGDASCQEERDGNASASESATKGARGEDASPRGEKKSRKQMAYVGAVYTIARFPRTVDEVLDEVARRRRQKDRPRPQNKRVWGEMTHLQEGERLINGRSSLFLHMAVECHLRDPMRHKPLICLMDGEEPLWTAKREWLNRAVEILDFFHALEHLWKVGRCFHNEGRALDKFVEHHARMFLEGKVDYAIRNFRRLARAHNLRGKKQDEVRRAIGYFRHNRERMHYDEYLRQGYPIGSGVAEGTCRNLVKDRMELTGMRWEYPGAHSMIYLRALYLNDEWDRFIDHRIEKEQYQLYGEDTIYGELSPYGQAT